MAKKKKRQEPSRRGAAAQSVREAILAPRETSDDAIVSPAATSVPDPSRASWPGPSSRDEAAPPRSAGPDTRRSTPVPPEGAPDVHIPVLGRVSFDDAASSEPPATELVPSYDLDVDTRTDVAPIGPTEAPIHGPPSSEQPTVPLVEPEEPTSVAELEQQIRELETRLDRMIRESGAGRPVPPPRPSRPAEPPRAASEPSNLVGTARELLSSDYYLRQWGKLGMRNRSEEVDEFGLDPKYEARYSRVFDFLYKRYFRVTTEGVEHIPAEGRCLVVANHSGGPLPYDGILLRTAVRREHPAKRELRWLAEDFIYYLPFVGAAMSRIGAVRACQENAERLLAGERLVAVFPEGAKGIGKLYKDRYKLQRFGRGGFIRLCLRTRTPLVPCAIIGAEEANPMLHRIEYMTKSFGMPYFPITPTFPALGPLGLLPAPTKCRIVFGEPMTFEGVGPEAADDDVLVRRLSERVRATIQAMLDGALAERKSVWFG
jgi:1-acyl-sn-glycerol-3-phosphate acyltransferase